MEFKDKVVFVRAKLNLTQRELGNLLHVSLVTICRWETGKVEPTKKAFFSFEQLCFDNNIKFNEVNYNGKIRNSI